MKNLLRRIFSSKIVCFALLAIEFIVVVVAWAFIEFRFVDYAAGNKPIAERQQIDFIVTIVFYALRALLYVIDMIVFFKIINREENPEYKIPWLACMFILPVWTITFYLLFMRTKLRKKDRKIVEPTKQMLAIRHEQHIAENKKLISEIDHQYQGVFEYLHNVTKLDISKNNRITYYKNGEEFFPEFVESLKLAEKFIFIEFFIIGNGKWWTAVLDVLKEKAKAGVDVRVVYDDIGSAGVVSNKLDLILQGYGIKCHKFHPVMPNLSNVVNNRDHRKIVVVDHKLAFTGGMNLADEYANDELRFGYWKDTMVKVEGPGIANFITTFLQDYDLATFSLTNYDEFVRGDYKEYKEPGYAFQFGDAPGPYQFFEQIGEQNYINLLNTATKRVDISTPYLICSYPLIRALTGAAKRGVEVNLIVPGVPDKKLVWNMGKSQFHIFLEAGVNLYLYTPGFNHEKQMLVDDRLVFCGTINFDFRSLTHHFETGITMLDAACIPEMKKDFEEMIAVSEKVPQDFKLPFMKRIIPGILKMFRVLF